MDKYALFTLLWTNIAIPVDQGGAPMIAALMATIGPWFKLCVGAFLLCMMLIAAWSSDDEAIQKLFRYCFLASLIYAIAFNAPTFDYYVTNLVHGTTDKISVAIANALNKGAPADANAYDIAGTRAFAIGLAVFKNLPLNPLKSVPLGMAVVVYWFVSYCGVVIMFSVKLVSYVLGDIIIDFGPMFIPLYFFPFTRRIFDGWLSVLLSTVVVQIFTAGLASLFIFVLGLVLNLAATGLAGNELGQVDGGIVVGEIMMLVAAALICLIFGVLAGVMVYVAVRITSGAHAELGKIRTPAWVPTFGGGGGQAQAAAPAAAAGGTHGGGGGSAHGPAPAGAPARDYAFNRPVGAAP